MRKSIFPLTIAALTMSASSAFAQAPKKMVPPPALPVTPVTFPAFTERTLSNKAQLVVVENHEQPVVSVNIYIKGAGQVSDTDAKPGVATMTASLLDAGTPSRTSKQIAEAVEGMGANIFTSAGPEWASVSATMLKNDVDAVLDILADVLLNPTFPADEVETERKRSLTDLQTALSRPATLAQRQFEAAVFGKHPYGRLQTTTGLRSITREDLVAFHQANYKPANALIVVSGDVNPAEISAKLESKLNKWTGPGSARPAFVAAPARTGREIILVNKPGAVQASYRIGHTIVPATSADWPALTVAQYIVGAPGSFQGWLMQELREKKGYTYGAFAQAAQRIDPGYIMMSGDVRNEVADSALTIFLDLMQKVKTQPIDAHNLDRIKSLITGSFPLQIETPSQVASQVASAMLLGQGKDHVTTWRQRVAAVTAADVQRVAKQYLHPENALIVVSGDAAVLKPKLEKFGKVTVVDEEGRPVAAAPAVPAPAQKANIDASSLQPMTATYTVNAQGMQVAEVTRTLTRATEKGTDLVKVKSAMTGMQMMNSELIFEAKTFKPVSASMNMQAQGMEANAFLTVADGKVTGMRKAPQAADPTMVDAEFAEGTLLSGMEEIALMLNDFNTRKELSFNTFSPQSGSVVPATAKLVGESKQKVAAGEFDTYEVEVKAGQGGMKLYLRKTAPHIVVKQEFMAQPVVIELKELK